MTSITDMTQDDLLKMIRNTVHDELQAVVKQEVSDRLDSFEQQLTQLSALRKEMGDVFASLEFTSKRLEELKSSSLPALYNHVERIISTLAFQTLDIDMHRRKWSLTINGLKGKPSEDDVDTRNACVWLARNHLGIPEADASDLAACHRLARTEDAGIILRFRDLSARNEWLSGAKIWKDTLTPSASALTCHPYFVRSETTSSRREKPCPQTTRKAPISATYASGLIWNS